jgi:hypothetical protein
VTVEGDDDDGLGMLGRLGLVVRRHRS